MWNKVKAWVDAHRVDIIVAVVAFFVGGAANYVAFIAH